jgi:hypothetical protein
MSSFRDLSTSESRHAGLRLCKKSSGGKLGASHSLLVTTLLLLLGRCGATFLLLVHDEAGVALLGIPFEAGKEGRVADFVISL